MTDVSHSFSELGDMPPDEFRRYGYEMIDWIADFFQNIDEIPVLPNVQPGDVKNLLPDQAPQTGEAMSAIFEDIDKIIMPGMTHWNHPRFMAYFANTGSAPGIFGEMLATAFNINGMLWKSCPASTELEQKTLDWLRELLNLPKDFWGIVYDTASISTLHAITAAREQQDDLKIRENGFADAPRMRLYMSEHGHSSIEKAVITLGFGLKSVRKIAADASYRMKPKALQNAIEEDLQKGLRPFCVVATAGTTSVASVDPVDEIASICEKYNIWLHCDAAYGGSAAVVPELQTLFSGWERADSIVVNPHKWLFTPMDFSAFYTRKPHILKRAFSLIPEYLKTQHDDDVENLMDYGVQLGRRFRSLKLWFVLRYYGREGLIQRIRKHIELAEKFADWVKENEYFELAAPPMFSTVVFRARPSQIVDEKQLNQLNEKLLERINAARRFFLSHTKLGARFVIRLTIGNIRTDEKHIGEIEQLLQDTLRQMLKEN